jgi:large subunit ribosomal protein L9
MKLILLESVDGLGRPGDQVNVKNGFARNFLLPQSKAVVLTPDSMRMLGRLTAKAESEERALISSMEEMAQKVSGLSVQVLSRATHEGHLFGSVTEKDIHLALVAAGWDIAQRAVRMTTHFKEVGTFEVALHLYGEISASIQVEVVPVDLDGTPIELQPAEMDDSDASDEADAADESADAKAASADAGDAPIAPGSAGDEATATA